MYDSMTCPTITTITIHTMGYILSATIPTTTLAVIRTATVHHPPILLLQFAENDFNFKELLQLDNNFWKMEKYGFDEIGTVI